MLERTMGSWVTRFLALALALGAAGCGGATSSEDVAETDEVSDALISPGPHHVSLMVGSVKREFLLYVPHAPQPMPLVLVFHGGGGSAMEMVNSTQFNGLADEHGFAVAYLEGTLSAPNDECPDQPAKQSWNNGLTPESGITVDDVGFVRKVISKLRKKKLVTKERVYAAGFSNGAMMSHLLGSQVSDAIAAVATVEGTIGINSGTGWNMIPTPKGPEPIMIVHGELDTTIPYNGGPAGAGCGEVETKSVADAVDFWRAANSCPSVPVSSSGGNYTLDAYACPGNNDVTLISITNGAHEWPGPTTSGFEASKAIWSFFDQHSL